MIDFVTKKEEFLLYKYRFNQIFTNEDFENNPFNFNFKFFKAFEFDFIYHELFFEGLKNFLKIKGEEKAVFYTIDPSPEDYFYKYYNKYSVFQISVKTTKRELSNIMMKDPGNNRADALAINSNEISWFSNSNDWAVIGSRDWEIAVVGFTNKKTKQKFINSFCEDVKAMFTSAQTQVNALNEMLSFNEKTIGLYKILADNYINRKN